MTLSGTVGNYRILDLLGQGGMGEVYRAVDTRWDAERVVALKILTVEASRNDQAVRRFRREVEVSVQLHHPNIVSIFDRGEHAGRLWFAMEYLEGRDLDELIRNPDSFSPAERMELAAQVCDALEFAHRKNIVHRDIKPSNVMVVRHGAANVAKLMDFGVAHLADADMTATKVQPGTIHYMSPEQARNEKIDYRSDLFSLGIVLYQLFTGEHPFRGTSEWLTVSNIVKEEAVPAATRNAAIPPALDSLIMKLLHKDPASRPVSAGSVGEAIRRQSRADEVSELPAGREEIEPARPPREPSDTLEDALARVREQLAAGRPADARESWHRAWTLAPESQDVVGLEAEIRAAELAIRTDPERESFIAERERIYRDALEAGRIDDARVPVVEILKRYPNEERALRFLDRLMEIRESGDPFAVEPDTEVTAPAAEEPPEPAAPAAPARPVEEPDPDPDGDRRKIDRYFVEGLARVDRMLESGQAGSAGKGLATLEKDCLGEPRAGHHLDAIRRRQTRVGEIVAGRRRRVVLIAGAAVVLVALIVGGKAAIDAFSSRGAPAQAPATEPDDTTVREEIPVVREADPEETAAGPGPAVEEEPIEDEPVVTPPPEPPAPDYAPNIERARALLDGAERLSGSLEPSEIDEGIRLCEQAKSELDPVPDSVAGASEARAAREALLETLWSRRVEAERRAGMREAYDTATTLRTVAGEIAVEGDLGRAAERIRLLGRALEAAGQAEDLDGAATLRDEVGSDLQSARVDELLLRWEQGLEALSVDQVLETFHPRRRDGQEVALRRALESVRSMDVDLKCEHPGPIASGTAELRLACSRTVTVETKDRGEGTGSAEAFFWLERDGDAWYIVRLEVEEAR